jgi:hypothetical protein
VVITELTYEPVPVPVGFISPVEDSDTSNKRSGVVQNTLAEVITEPIDEPLPDPAEFPLPLRESALTGSGDTNDTQPSVQNGLGEAISEPTSEPAPVPAEFTLPAEAIELDLLDCDAIPTLIASVLRGTNVNEFLERLEVLAYTGAYSGFICTVD